MNTDPIIPRDQVLTVAVPNDDLLRRLEEEAPRWGSRVSLVPWSLQEPLPNDLAKQIDMVAIGHYWEGKFDWSLLEKLPNLKIVQLPSAGFEHALPYIPAGVALCNGRGVHSAETAELAIGLTLAMQRGIADARDHQKDNNWVFKHYQSLADRRVLLIGYGSVGQAVAARLRPFEVELTIVNRDGGENSEGAKVHSVSELPDLVPNAEIVILTVPLNDETHHLVADAFLNELPDGALIVNVARGRVIDQEALLRHLQSGRIRAALDVTTPEPLPADHPLWAAPNLLITPHQGGNTDAGYPRYGALVRRQINHLLSGEPLENAVNTHEIERSLGKITTNEYA